MCGALEAPKAEHLQPVWVRRTGQEFGRRSTDPVRLLSALQRAVIKKKAQQIQVAGTDLAAQEEYSYAADW